MEDLTLEVVAGPELAPIPLDPDQPMSLGRSSNSDVQLPDKTVSRSHAIITCRQGAWTIVDSGSRHGTYVNGVQIDRDVRTPLQPGDLLRIGPWTFRANGTGDAPPGSVSTQNDLATTANRVHRVPDRELQSLAQHRLEVLIDCCAHVYAARSEEELALSVLSALCEGTGFARAAMIRSLKDNEVQVVGAHSQVEGISTDITFSRSLINAARDGGMVRITRDAPVNYGESIARLGIHSALCAPVRIGNAVGAYLYLDARDQEDHVHADAAAFCQAIARMCGLAMNNLAGKAMAERQQQLEADLHAAHQAQAMIVPPNTGRIGDLEYAMKMVPGRYVAGDLFDVVRREDGRVGILLGDVTGKGIPAAMLMATAQTYLHALLRTDDDLGRIVSTVNAHVASHSVSERFISLWVGLFDPEAGTVQIVDAGHGHWVWIPKDGDPECIRTAGGIPLGIDDDFEYPVETRPFEPGARLVAFSDGVVEQADKNAEMFGIERVLNALRSCDSPHEDVDALYDAVCTHANATALADDLTIASVVINT